MMNALKTALMGLVLAVLLAGAGLVASSPSPQPVAAAPANVLLLNGTNCITLGVAFGGLSATVSALSCVALGDQTKMQDYVRCLRGGDANLDGVRECLPLDVNGPVQVTPKDFAPLDLDKNQVYAQQDLLVLAFVKDDAPVRFTTDFGVMGGNAATDPTSGKNAFCEANVTVDAQHGDPDCDGDPATLGDGLVMGRVKITSADGTGTGHVTAIQNGIGFPVTFTVTGVPKTITVTPLFGKDTIQTGATAPPTIPIDPTDPADIPEPTDCTFLATAAGVLGANNDAEKAVLVAKALDNDGVPTVGALLRWDHPFVAIKDPFGVILSGPTPQGGVALPQTPTIDAQALGVAFPQFVCGGTEPGDLKLKVTFDRSVDANLDTEEFVNVVVKVVGPPATMTLVADPAVVDCNGTNSAKVTATVNTAAGGPVADGVDVKFAVDVLGTANPLVSNSGKGTASTTVTPLSSDIQRGVPVIVTAGDVQSSILVRCSGVAGAAVAPAPEGGGGAVPGGGATPATGRPTGTIRGPDTGSAGVQGSGALSWWPVLALAAAASLLAGVRFALRRSD